MSKETIWRYLKQNTKLPDVSIAGIMGNMEAESNCESCRLQGDFSVDRTTSKAYAQMVNNGTYTSFANDAKGWGLAQWTFNSRKQNLLSSCKSQGKGIEDEEAQLAFMLAEMQSEYPATWKALLSAQDIATAAYVVCVNYEKPAVNNTAIRTSLGQKIYDQFHGTDIKEPDKLSEIISHLEAIIQLLKEMS